MQLPGDMILEMFVPDSTTVSSPALRRYRVSGSDRPALELMSLREVAAHLHCSCRPEELDEFCIGPHLEVEDHQRDPEVL